MGEAGKGCRLEEGFAAALAAGFAVQPANQDVDELAQVHRHYFLGMGEIMQPVLSWVRTMMLES